MNKKLFSILFVLSILIDAVPCKNLASFGAVDITISADDEKAFINAVKSMSQNGGVVKVNTKVIHISTTSTIKLSGSASGGIIGQKQSGNVYPIINFKQARNNGSTARGFTIDGSNKYMKYLIVEMAGDNGIWVSGSKNTLEHIITRYNNDSGIQLSDNADSNVLTYCYSYRNIDVKTYGANADAFAPKLGATNTRFKYCFGWDNSDDGWDSYDKEGDYSAKVEYLNCACWNNGNPEVFTGKYDYDNGNTLDKNMWTVQYLVSTDKNYESNYNNRKFQIGSGAKIAGIAYSTWLSKAEGEMNGNGFKFGSKTTAQSTKVYRKAVYSVAFDHKSKGFDNNNSKGCTGYIANCVSFNNNINYQLPYVFEKWASNWSWNPKKAHQSQQNQGLHYPSNSGTATKSFYAVRDKIITLARSCKFDDTINFDDTIRNLA